MGKSQCGHGWISYRETKRFIRRDRPDVVHWASDKQVRYTLIVMGVVWSLIAIYAFGWHALIPTAVVWLLGVVLPMWVKD